VDGRLPLNGLAGISRGRDGIAADVCGLPMEPALPPEDRARVGSADRAVPLSNRFQELGGPALLCQFRKGLELCIRGPCNAR